MKRQITLEGGSLRYTWDLTVDEWLDLVPAFGEMLGVPRVEHLDGTVFDLRERIAQRMGEVGKPIRRITIEPVPEEVPEPISTPAPAEPDRVPA